MVVSLVERGGDILEWDAVGGYVVDGLDIEGFFDLGVGCGKEVEEDEEGDERIEDDICSRAVRLLL